MTSSSSYTIIMCIKFCELIFCIFDWQENLWGINFHGCDGMVGTIVVRFGLIFVVKKHTMKSTKIYTPWKFLHVRYILCNHRKNVWPQVDYHFSFSDTITYCMFSWFPVAVFTMQHILVPLLVLLLISLMFIIVIPWLLIIVM